MINISSCVCRFITTFDELRLQVIIAGKYQSCTAAVQYAIGIGYIVDGTTKISRQTKLGGETTNALVSKATMGQNQSQQF